MTKPFDINGPIRIAYLTYRGKPHVGGQGVYSRHLTKALVDLGHHVEVLAVSRIRSSTRAFNCTNYPASTYSTINTQADFLHIGS